MMEILKHSVCMKMTGDTNRVGIHVATPTEQLDVDGTVKATDFKFTLTDGGTYIASNLYGLYETLDSSVGTLF